MKYFVVTTVHPSDDVRIYHKYVSSLARSKIIPCELFYVFSGERLHEEMLCAEIKVSKVVKTRLLSFFIQPVVTVFKIWKYVTPGSIVHLHDPELLLVGWVLKLRGARLFYDAHEDLVKQLVSKPYLEGQFYAPVRLLIRGVFRFLLRTSDLVVGATPEITCEYAKAVNSTITVRNLPLEREIGRLTPYNSMSCFLFYAGAINEIRGALRMLNLLDALPEFKLILCGKFRTEKLLKTLEGHRNWDRVEYYGLVDRRKMFELACKSRVGLLLFDTVPNHIESLPNKLTEYLSVGLPIIHTNIPKWRRLTLSSSTSLAINIDNIEDEYDRIREYVLDSTHLEIESRYSLEYILENHLWESEFNNFVSYLMSDHA